MESDEEQEEAVRDYFTAVYRVGEAGAGHALEIPKHQASANAIKKLIETKLGRSVGTLYYWSTTKDIWKEVKHEAIGDGVCFMATSPEGLSLDLLLPRHPSPRLALIHCIIVPITLIVAHSSPRSHHLSCFHLRAIADFRSPRHTIQANLKLVNIQTFVESENPPAENAESCVSAF
jgi:hypothetical protein